MKRVAAALMGAAFLSIAVAPNATQAADEASVLRLRAETLARDDRCAEVLDVASQGLELAPGDERLHRIRGLCHERLGDNEAAVADLEAAFQGDPTLPDVALRLGVAQYKLGNYAEATTALDTAAQQDPENAEGLYYRGLLAYEGNDGAGAAALLEESASRDPETLDPIGSYHAGLAWERAEDPDRARRALERAIEADPDSEWADRSREALGRIDSRSRLRRWAQATVGMEYDSNAVLRGEGVDLPDEISNEEDGRGSWRLEVGQELLRKGPWSAGIVGAYQGYAYTSLDDFDLHYPSVSLWVDYRINESTLLRFQPDFGYGWRDGDPYIATYGGTAALHKDWERFGSSRFYTRFDRSNLLFGLRNVQDGPAPCPNPLLACGPAGLNEARERNRDGNRWLFGFDHTYALGAKTDLRGGFAHERYDARGREYSFLGYEPWIGVSQDLFWKVTGHVRGSYQRRNYRHPSTFPDPDIFVGVPYTLSSRNRKENTYRAEVSLERPINRFLSASVRWRYTKNDSNREVFDYNRHVAGAFLTFAWSN